MRFGSKGMTCLEFVNLMRERGITYDAENGKFITRRGCDAGKETPNGYRLVMLQRDKIEYRFCEHRCVWTWFYGEIPNGMEINHIDANRSNNRIENLEVVNHAENMQHAKKMGNLNPAKADRSGKAIYTNEEVIAMRTVHKNGMRFYKIAEMVGQKNSNVISRLVKGQRYGSISGTMDAAEAMTLLTRRGRKTVEGNVGQRCV